MRIAKMKKTKIKTKTNKNKYKKTNKTLDFY
jgi:hypothetical protein